MPERQVAEVLLESEQNVLGIDQVLDSLERDVSRDKVAREIQRIADRSGADYTDWRHNTGNYDVSEVRKYEQEIREEYDLQGLPDRVESELEDLGL